MSLPILQPQSQTNLPQIRGDVTIDPNVIIASGVILNATPGYQITIHAGVCLGMGTIITAHQGNVEIEANAILGPGTLILGNCKIGSQASLGTSVTVYNANVDSLAVIPAGTIIGDPSRRVEAVVCETVIVEQTQKDIPPVDKTQPKSINDKTTYTPSPKYNSQNKLDTDDNILDKIDRLNQNGHSPHLPDVSNAQPAKPKSLAEVEAIKADKAKSIDNTDVWNTTESKSSDEIQPSTTGKVKSLEEIEAIKIAKAAEEKAKRQNKIEERNDLPVSPPTQQPRQKISTEEEKKKYQSYFYQNYLNKDIKQPNSSQKDDRPPTITSEDTLPKSPSNSSSSQSQSLAKPKQVVGKVYINRLLYTLFPDKKRTQ